MGNLSPDLYGYISGLGKNLFDEDDTDKRYAEKEYEEYPVSKGCALKGLS